MKRKSLAIGLTLCAVVALLTGTKLYACYYVPAYGDCELDPPLTCIPNERPWELYGNSTWDTCYCDEAPSGWEYCEEEPSAAWCSSWYNCNSQCTTCIFDGNSSFPVNYCEGGS